MTKNESLEKENRKKRSNPNFIVEQTLLEPWITEAASNLMAFNKYVFKISPRAGKNQVKKAVENLYKVKVTAVNTITMPRKFRIYGRTSGWKTGFKKAIVTLKPGDKIELFEGA